MNPTEPQTDLHQDCLAKLSRALDLVIKTAEAASAENNHKVVVQAAREATRIVAQIIKMTDPKAKPRSALVPRTDATGPESTVSPAGQGRKAAPALENERLPSRPHSPGANPPAVVQSGKDGVGPNDFMLPDLDTFFPPREVASWDSGTQALFQNISQSYQELQAIGAEMAAALEAPASDRGNCA
jgi:hypothetical protein